MAVVTGTWVSGRFPPLVEGTYKVKFRSAKARRHQFVWTGHYWLSSKGERVPGTQTDYFKWFSTDPLPDYLKGEKNECAMV